MNTLGLKHVQHHWCVYIEEIIHRFVPKTSSIKKIKEIFDCVVK